MKNAERSSPMRLAAWALVGNLVMAGAVFFEVVVYPKLSNRVTALPVWAFRLFTFTIPFLAGLAIIALVVQKLRGGMKKGAWTDAELEPLRRRLRNPVWGVASGALFILAIGVVVTDRGFGHAGWFCFLILPFQILLQIVNAVRPAESAREHIDGNGSAAIRSERWGEPPTGTVD
ncbi:hypothetical protein [Tunturiibacter gelidoferens]|jgi:hypothetical protein|uniref:Uncharacterized protein n=1 Tax=Tunturiibacter gelidiferens TaxID=3069689 RepID=A0A9X0QAC9_9BACT|nr:hypothetical protein [Edaphobacter lichenicola]MBB5326936.1 hypothetical protein [Edaphobacter lichenicola]